MPSWAAPNGQAVSGWTRDARGPTTRPPHRDHAASRQQSVPKTKQTGDVVARRSMGGGTFSPEVFYLFSSWGMTERPCVSVGWIAQSRGPAPAVAWLMVDCVYSPFPPSVETT